jgi:gliding motility-associated-like protein
MIFYAFLCFCIHPTYAQINCNNWLYTPSHPSYVQLGQLNVTGNQITVEAVINRSTPTPEYPIYNGDIVSKHNTPADVNYLLRSFRAEITTTDGYFATPWAPDIEPNTNYHIAMVYDGKQLKFYRNGCLVGEVNASGNLIQNSWNTRIGDYEPEYNNENFIGYINEVRIWNVARTQAEIKTYMNSSLPNPTTQTGLLAYYTFDNLLNKQGNASWNGTLGGSAVINKTNPQCNSIMDVCNSTSLNCNNWLSTPSVPSYVEIGQLNIPGNKVTVEALINRTQAFVPGGGDNTEGDIVSKHDNPTDVNYLLRPNHAFITTTNGFFQTPDIANIQLNKTYHVAMVYDGDTLKFYRDGCLMSKIAATGDLYQNNWNTRIGYYQNQIWNTNFIGYINEVRIWNVARTQVEIQTYMNTSLPNPTSQSGLLAYYTFDSLVNKQGNSAWNGTLGGSASINEANTNRNAIDNLCVVNCDINITKSFDTSLCGNSPVNIFAAGGSTYSWIPATGLSDPGIANPVATPLSSTKYYVTVSNPDGCSKKDSINIIVNSLPVIFNSNDTSICLNSSANLLASGGTSYIWNPAATLNHPDIANPVATPTTNTTYNVKVTNDEGCSKSASINVSVNAVPVITISNDSTICNKTSVKLFVTGGNSYIWSPSSSLNNTASPSPVASPLATTNYHVNITDANSCTYLDSVKITVRPPAIFSVSPDNTVCATNSQQLNASGGDTYTWSPESSLDNPNTNNPIATPDQTTTYSVNIKENTCNESAILFTKLTVLPLPYLQVVKSNDITCSLPYAHLSAYGTQDYTWTPESGLSNPSIANPVATPTVSTIYTVVGKDINGCTNSDTISVNVDFNGKILYGLPNSFTPNGDGLNDCFGVKYWGQVDDLDFNIYNRFGQRVFHTNNPSICWDGTFEGRAQVASVFVYTIKAKTACGNIERKGTVTLLR